MKKLAVFASQYWELFSFLGGWLMLHPVGQLALRWFRS